MFKLEGLSFAVLLGSFAATGYGDCAQSWQPLARTHQASGLVADSDYVYWVDDSTFHTSAFKRLALSNGEPELLAELVHSQTRGMEVAGRMVYLNEAGGDRILVYDAESKITSELHKTSYSVGIKTYENSPRSMVYSLGQIFWTGKDSTSVEQLDPVSGISKTLARFDMRPVILAKNRSKLFVGLVDSARNDEIRQVLALEKSTGRTQEVVSSDIAITAAFADESTFYWATAHRSGTGGIYRRALTRRAATEVLMPNNHVGGAFASDGSSIYFAYYGGVNRGLFQFRKSTKEIRKLLSGFFRLLHVNGGYLYADTGVLGRLDLLQLARSCN